MRRAQLDIDLLRNFAAIAELGAMSRAAARVGQTQAALSQQVKRLEMSLQQTLMIRTARGIVLTSHGERLLLHAQKILRTYDEAIADLFGVSLSGNIRFGCPDDYARIFVPPLLQRFSQQHPQVFVEVVCAPTPQLVESLKGQVLDITIVSVPNSRQSDQVLRREPLVWVGAKGSDVCNHDPLQLALSDLDMVDHQEATSRLERTGRKYRIVSTSGSVAGLTAVVRSGQAITVLTQSAVPPDLQILPPSSGLPKLPSVGIGVKTEPSNSSRLLGSFESHVRSVLPTL